MNKQNAGYRRRTALKGKTAEVSGGDHSEYQLDSMSMFDATGSIPGQTSYPKSKDLQSKEANFSITKRSLRSQWKEEDLYDLSKAGIEDGGQRSATTRNAGGSNNEKNKTHVTSGRQMAFIEPAKKQEKRKDSGIEETMHEAINRPVKQRRIDQEGFMSRSHDLHALFMTYLENHSDPEYDELVALTTLTRELSALKEYPRDLVAEVGTKFAAAFFTVSFPAWLSFRKEIVEVKRKYETVQSTAGTSHRHRVVLERSRLAARLRQAHETFMDAGFVKLRPEEIIVQAMPLLMEKHEDSQGAEMIWQGFVSMEEELMTLSDRLMGSGGTKWVMGGFPPISVLKGLQSL